MKYKGEICSGEESGEITDIVITDKRIAADIDMKQYTGFMEIHSDGENYTGTFQYSDESEPSDDISGRLFKPEGAMIFIGMWTHAHKPYHFHMIFEEKISPNDE